MRLLLMSGLFPKYLWALLAIYFVASFTHFSHNAEYIAYYPHMPAWISRETVYLAWLVVSALGVAGIALSRIGLPLIGALMLAIYGAFGLDGLEHYALALCSEHTLAMNLTIWAEVLTGLVLALCCVVLASRMLVARTQAQTDA